MSLDVVTLYSNIPVEDAISAAVNLLDKHQHEVDMLGLCVEDVHSILQQTLTNNIFELEPAILPAQGHCHGKPSSTTNGKHIDGISGTGRSLLRRPQALPLWEISYCSAMASRLLIALCLI